MNLPEARTLSAKERLELARSKKTVDRIFLVDTSGSMCGDKIDCAKEALKKYIRKHDVIISFSEEVNTVPHSAINFISPWGQTAMLPAIQKAIESKPKHVILISDGLPNVRGNEFDVLQFIGRIKGVKFDTIGIGTEVYCDCNKPFLETIAETTGGRYQYIDNPVKLGGAIALLVSNTAITA